MPENKLAPSVATAAVAVLAVLLLGCPGPKPGANGNRQTSPAQTPVARPVLTVVLVASDLGLGDGQFIREADAALAELAQTGVVNYTPVGTIPVPLAIEAGVKDVGLPALDSSEPGSMTLDKAVALLPQVPPCDILVLSCPELVAPALTQIAAQAIQAQAILVLDEEGCALPVDSPVPLYMIRYQIKDIAFLCGVAAAASSNNGMLVVMANTADPQAGDFLSAVAAGAKYWTAGAVIRTATVAVDATSGIVEAEQFSHTLNDLLQQAGPYFTSNHYVVSLGRTTPAILNALSRQPLNAFVCGGYADYRVVRPERIIGCAEKHPGAALKWIFSHLGAEGLTGLAPDGVLELGLAEDAVGFTGVDLYARYHPDAEDIGQAVDGVLKLIKADELDYPY